MEQKKDGKTLQHSARCNHLFMMVKNLVQDESTRELFEAFDEATSKCLACKAEAKPTDPLITKGGKALSKAITSMCAEAAHKLKAAKSPASVAAHTPGMAALLGIAVYIIEAARNQYMKPVGVLGHVVHDVTALANPESRSTPRTLRYAERAAPLLAAPETAAERDALKEINKDLLAALAAMVYVYEIDGENATLKNARAAMLRATEGK